AAPEVPPSAPTAAPSDVPDWLSSLQTAAPEVPPSAPTAAPSEVPDWLSGLQAAVPEAPSSAPTTAPSEVPDWLSGLQTAAPETPPSVPPSAPSPKPFPTGTLRELGALSEPESSAEVPDWLAGLTGGTAFSFSSETASVQEKPAEPVATPQPELPDLSNASTPSPFSASETPSIDSLLMDIPDWLAGFTPSPETSPSEPAAPEQTDLQPVELPSWVQAMRPVETMLTGVDAAEAGEEAEQQGPLAGLRSVLPSVPGVLEIRKPKPYPLKLQAGETQRTQAALLERLLSSETESKPVAAPEKVPLLRPLRWVLFGLLTLAVLLPAILGSRFLSVPELPTDPNAPFNRFYDTLSATVPNDALVLVVTDYPPGFAGELEQAAVPVVTHLMRKNARLTFLSTSPLSMEMGERLLQKSRAVYARNGQQPPSYVVGQQYLFLGYLPGGAAGVKGFAEQPQKMTGVDSVSGDLWQTDMLRDKVTDLSGFDVVLVITDDPDNGRLWIEQTAGRIGNTPLLMVTSAQAGPLIQPYAASGQLDGLVIGLEGGALYEKRDSQPGQVYPGHIKALYWDGFGAAWSIALLAILFGALWSLVERFRARNDAVEQDEA
ncbi:MAG: hypothetical protein NZP74_06295, partial [Anaerolineales bacterium]|nr:hypothetical protein [Anaerolineales bacterium]